MYKINSDIPNLYDAVRAGFAAKNKTLHGFCKDNGIRLDAARDSLFGSRRGDDAEKLRKQLMRAAGVEVV
jgi:hypothetical protein